MGHDRELRRMRREGRREYAEIIQQAKEQQRLQLPGEHDAPNYWWGAFVALGLTIVGAATWFALLGGAR